jgi:hypothetical protein
VPSRKLWAALQALDGYLTGQNDWLVNYAERHRGGLRIGTAITGTTANFLVNRRMYKSQQMMVATRHRSSAAGSSCRLQWQVRIGLWSKIPTIQRLISANVGRRTTPFLEPVPIKGIRAHLS